MRSDSPPGQRVLISGLAGTWYEGDPDDLRAALEALLAAPRSVPPPPGPVSALILPHAGYAYCGPVAAEGVRLLRGRTFRRVIVIGPSHRVRMPDLAAVPRADRFRTILGEIPLDIAALEGLRAAPGFFSDPRLDSGEHSVEILFPLLQSVLGPFALVPVVIGQLGEDAVRTLAEGIRPLLDPGALVVVSSDFTHYGPRFDYTPFTGADTSRRIEALDFAAFERIRSKDLPGFRAIIRDSGATVCGWEAISILLALLGPDQQVHRLAYDTSGRVTGDWENTVSYLSAAVTGPWPPAGLEADGLFGEADRRALLGIVRASVERRLFPARAVRVPEPTPALRRPAGVFVTLHRRGRLRGCIGRIEPDGPLDETAAEMAEQSAFGDPRFHPVEPEEWPEIELEVSVLTPPRAVASWRKIEIGRHGILLHKQGRSAVFLPQVAPEQGWDLPETLRQLSRKAGLPADAWERDAQFEVFEAILFRESPVPPPCGPEPRPA
jgi:hypothetical protein